MPSDLPDIFNSTRPKLFRSFESPIETVRLLSEHFPSHVSEVVRKADRIGRGLFDLLGYTDLFFRTNPPDWHFDPISGKTSPRIHWSRIREIDASQTGDKKVIWELSRHQYFSVLGQAYVLTRDEEYARTFVKHVKDWCENDPPKIGVNWRSSLEVAFRSISWVWALLFFKGSPTVTGDDIIRILAILHLNGRHLESYLSTYFSPNTHLTGEALGLYYLGSFLPEYPESARWRELGYKILIDSLDAHVLPDGVYCEQSSHYHRYTTDFYLNLLILREVQGEPVEPKHREKLHLLFEHLKHITQPNGESPLYGDEDGGRLLPLDFSAINDFRPTLAVGATLLGRGDLKFVAGGPTPELLWLLGPGGLEKFDALEPARPDETFKAFPDGGFYCARTSWTTDADHIVIACGPHGFLNGGHAHADALNFILSVGGRPLFVDSGTFVYTPDLTARDRFRSSAAHNCLTVDGVSSSVPSGPFSWQKTAAATPLAFGNDSAGATFAGKHDGFHGLGVAYSRKIEFTGRGCVTVVEQISSQKVHTFEISFILAPDLSAEIEGEAVMILEGRRKIAAVDAILKSRSERTAMLTWDVDDWQVSFAYGSALPSKRLTLRVNAVGDFSIVSTIRDVRTVRQATEVWPGS